MRLYWRILLAIFIGLFIGFVIHLGQQYDQNYAQVSGVLRSDGQVIGGDFLAFYVGGHLYATSPEALYDPDAQRAIRAEILGPADGTFGDLPFVYPPLVAALASVIARLPFQQAYLAWTFFGLATSLASLLVLVRVSGASRVIHPLLALLLTIGFVPYSMNTFLGGQLSWLGVAVLALTTAAVLRDRPFTAGVMLSLSYYKPPLFLLLLIILCLTQGRRFLAGFGAGAATLVLATFASVGLSGVQSFLATVSRYTYGQDLTFGFRLPPDQGVGLVALGVTLLGSMAVTVAVLAPFAVALSRLSVRLLSGPSEEERDLGLIIAIVTSLAFSVQLINYDLALLLVPMVLAARWHGRKGTPEQSLILLPLLAFYFEFAVRQVEVNDWVLNGAALLFVALLAGLSWYARTWYPPRGKVDKHRTTKTHTDTDVDD